MGRYRERILFIVLLALTGAVFALTFHGGVEMPDVPSDTPLFVELALPAKVSGGRVCVGADRSAYLPSDLKDKRVFGPPPRIERKWVPVVLEIPVTDIPAAPAASTDPGPALEHSSALPRGGAGIDPWKQP